MKFHRSVPKEQRTLLENDLKQYEKEVQMSKKELQELRQWAQDGNSPYDNGWYIFTDYGTPMDYISAKRLLESGACIDAEYNTVNDSLIMLVRDEQENNIANEELPF